MAKFLTSARSVDMLGRQQIAGIPTAVSEIFKNAYDAYANTVRGDFFPRDRVLTIRDDGVGMTPEDLQARWLTVGTDSKASGSALPSIPRPHGAAERRQMGEKGIGRLAIATLGPQLLLASRAQRNIGTPEDVVVLALISWTLFEIPGLTLDDVTIPVRTVDNIDQADLILLDGMRAEIMRSVRALDGRVSPHFRERIEREIAHSSFDPRVYLTLNGPSLRRGPGTAFIVAPVSDDLDAVMETPDKRDDEFSVSEFQRFLLGFSNTITNPSTASDFSTEFVRHESSSPRDIIDPNSYFWTSDDFKNTDHTIEGEFDEYGAFSGRLSIYGAQSVDINEPWKGGRGDRSACGPFRIKFGYVQGKASESRLTPEAFVAMTSRLEKIGGLYVYRDGIRVLPYGNSDNDYLEIEKRRSLNAATYYFSYRRMFGAIDIDSAKNGQLQEKAGREGFRENRAYRDFKGILQNFLIQLAADFFSSKAPTAQAWREQRARLERHSASRNEKIQAERRARERFAKQVSEAIHYIESGRFAEDASACAGNWGAEIHSAAVNRSQTDTDALEQKAVEALQRLRRKVDVEKPAHLAISRDEERDWNAYRSVKVLADDAITNAAKEIEQAFVTNGYQARSAPGTVAGEARYARLHELADWGALTTGRKKEQVIKGAERVGDQIIGEANARADQFKLAVAEVLEDATEMGLAEEYRLSEELILLTNRYSAVLDDLTEQVGSLLVSEGLLSENMALKEEILDLQDQIEGNLELLQLGQAVQIVSHEFEASIRSVRSGLKDLTPWARATPRLQPIVRDLRASFAHLDGYLRLFTPLQRRLYREAVVISGEEVEFFLRGVFADRLLRHSIEMVATDAFKKWTFEGYPSTFYPAFVNIVDNAIHWIASEADAQNLISLDADALGAYVRDTGPGVRPRDRDAIFERGFSRRRGGRGLGLSLAKELLERDGWRLDLRDSPSGAEFGISLAQPGEGK